MKEPVGLSNIFPACPILNAISVVLLLSIIPGFLKTKIFTLIAALVLLLIANLISCVNMIIWRNNVRDAPIYADIVSHWWSVFPQLLYVDLACFAKFVWHMSRPGSAVFLYDDRRKINRVDAMMFGGAALILIPFEALSFNGRYGILEDFGPWLAAYNDMRKILLETVPLTLMTIMSTVFNTMTLRNIIRRRRQGSSGDGKIVSNARINKYTFIAITSLIFMLFGTIWNWYGMTKSYLLRMDNYDHVFVPLSEFRKTIHRKFFWTRAINDRVPDVMIMLRGYFLSIPVSGMYFFVVFGLGKEARQTHRENFQQIARLLGWKRQANEASESSDPEKSHSCRKWRLPAIFERVFPSHHNEKVLVAPFDLPSNSSLPSLEKVDSDTGHHTTDKARGLGRINADRPPSLSMHKPSLPSPSQSSSTSNDEQPQTHRAVSSGKRRLPSDGVQSGLESLPRPQHKPPLPPSARLANSNDNAEQNRPEVAPVAVPPPAYVPETPRGPVDLV
ncbi:hypothetical protein CPB86DRAFT_735032 [Serendipita vermifera]|nr:hypothetical protein CPB86DRAFT_735032 [Serendipita vermifera]